MSKFSALAIAILACSSSLVAAETLTLDNELENVTEIATKTKVNADYVPGAVTIIKGKDLKALGITNLAETNAFDMIVGFDSSVKSLRGSGSIYGSQGNKIKWMINDKPISSEIWGNGIRGVGPIAFPIPVDAVDRIEIISGPGSSLYGENAIYGVVNIITKKDQNGVYSTLARNENDKYGIAVGGFTNYNKDDLNINLHVSSFSDDGWNLKVGTNGNYYNSVVAAQTPGNGPGNLPSNREGRVVMADIDYKNWSFWAYRLENKSGYAYSGWNPTWSLPAENDGYGQSDTYSMLGVKNEFYIGDIKLVPQVSYNRYENSAKNEYSWPASYLLNDPSGIDGLFNQTYTQQQISAGIDIFKKISNQQLTGGISFTQTRVLNDYTWKNYNYSSPFTIVAPLTYSSTPVASTTLDGTKPIRTQKSIYVQDEFNPSPKATVTMGARYDSFSDNDAAFSPRIALVYRYNEANILKAQYSRAFRPPSFAEQYTSVLYNKKIKPEVVDTIDLGIIHKHPEHTVKATIFASRITDMITFHDFTYETMNLDKPSTIYGLETEFTKHLAEHDFGVNLALYDTRRDDVVVNLGTNPNNPPEYFNYNASRFGLAANVFLNVFVTLNRDSMYPTTLWYHYTGQKNRVNNALLDGSGNIRNSWASPSTYYTENGATPAQDYLNISQKVRGLYKNLELDFGIKNAFGKTLKTLYMPLNPPNNQDVPYMRQTIWFSAAYKF